MSTSERSGLFRRLIEGRYFEGPRWHDGRLCVSDTLARSVWSVELDGEKTRICEMDDIPCGLGHLPGGELLVLGMFQKRLWRLSDGAPALHVELSSIAAGTIDDMIVDREGRTYVGDLGFDLMSGPAPGAVGRILLVTADGKSRVVAEGLDFPNGIAVSADGTRLVVAESRGDRLCEFRIEKDGSLSVPRRFGSFKEPDGLCLDEQGCAWVALFSEDAFVRVDPSGHVVERIATPGRRAIACCFGGADGRSLFCVTAVTTHEDLMQGRSISWIEVTDVEVRGSGAP
jgi:sugar lactone lactonase YvrE